jgi:hypothetical protein
MLMSKQRLCSNIHNSILLGKYKRISYFRKTTTLSTTFFYQYIYYHLIKVMEYWRGNTGITRGDIHKSGEAFDEFLSILSPDLEHPIRLLQQYWEKEVDFGNAHVYLALQSLERILSDNPPLSKVLIFYDQQSSRGGRKYDAVYAFFTDTAKTWEGTYRWQLNKKRQEDECLKIRDWASRYGKVVAPSSESDEGETTGKHTPTQESQENPTASPFRNEHSDGAMDCSDFIKTYNGF